MELVTGMHRKSLVRRLNGSLKRKRRSREREETYGPDVDDALRLIDESLGHICADRLTPNLPWMAQHLARHGEMDASPSLLEQLEEISISTVKRRLKRVRRGQPRLPRSKGSKRANKLSQDIPMRRIPWDEQEPGHFETDLVHHCGPSASGEYICTLQMVDVLTGWSERRAVLGRSRLVMEDAFRYILARLPFPVLEIHPDNGSEFLNHHMLDFWGDIVQGVRLSRSRPYQKNDNRFVEQKNSPLVRAYLGHDRYDTVAQTMALNRLYDKMWLYYNFFQPVMRLEEKIVCPATDGHPTRITRRHDQARTPFERLCDTTAILPQHKDLLMALRDRTNLRQLCQDIWDALDRIYDLPGATPGITEDVFKTLEAVSTPHIKLQVSDGGLFALSFARTPILKPPSLTRNPITVIQTKDSPQGCGQRGQPQKARLPTPPTAPTAAPILSNLKKGADSPVTLSFDLMTPPR
jgi:hypothetical protein